MDLVAYRGAVLHCLARPGAVDDAVEYLDDGLLIVRGGKVDALGEAAGLLPTLAADIDIVDLRGKLLVPGFIDCHVHYPQIEIIASYGERLLDWLEKYAFPAEQRFADPQHAADVAGFFADQLLQNGTTTALVFATVHPESVDAMFAAARQRNMRLITGKVLMDRNCPDGLRDSATTGYEQSKALLEKWHGVDRLSYAITPRFAVTSSEEQLRLAGRLATEHPDVYVHTHLAENDDECASIARQFPWSRSYFDVYDHYQLVRERAVFAHCLHLDRQDRDALAARQAAIAFCPTSNLFLGSGLFDLAAARDAGVRVGVGTDVGGGTSLSVLRTLSAAYKVLQLQGQSLHAFEAFYLATLGAARALHLDDRIGNFVTGKEADFTVLDLAATPLMARRTAATPDIAGQLFALLMLGDDRSVAATYLLGKKAWGAD